MKYIHPFLALCCIFLSASSCESYLEEDDLLGNWIRRSDFEGVPRSNAVAFTIGSKAFVGLGFDGDEDLKDFWQYDPDLNFWTKKDTFPGISRRASVAFAIDGKGYVGTGYSSELNRELKDFWAFDPEAEAGHQWERISDFPGTARYNAVAFGLKGTGFVGTGFDKNWLKDFYSYNPEDDHWVQIVSMGGSKMENAVAFVIDDKAYVGTGQNNGTSVFELWEYEPEGTIWNRKLDLDVEGEYLIARHGAVAFTLDRLGYITTGNSGGNLNSVWEYVPTNDNWVERTPFEGVPRQDAVAFTVSGRSYLCTGRSGSTRFDDLWEFVPAEGYSKDD